MKKWLLNRIMKGYRIRTILGFTITKIKMHYFDEAYYEHYYFDYDIERKGRF